MNNEAPAYECSHKNQNIRWENGVKTHRCRMCGFTWTETALGVSNPNRVQA